MGIEDVMQLIQSELLARPKPIAGQAVLELIYNLRKTSAVPPSPVPIDSFDEEMQVNDALENVSSDSKTLDEDAYLIECYMERNFAMENFTCPVCGDDIEKYKGVHTNCLHNICFECFGQLINVSIKDRKVGRCPTENCKEVFTVFHVQNVFPMDKDMCSNYLLSEQKAIAETIIPKAYHCPTPNCTNAIEIVGDLAASNLNYKFNCTSCGKSYCVRCNARFHVGQTCDQYKISRSGREVEAKMQRYFKEMKERGLIKPCPKCKAHIEKNKGCDHMTCSKCKYEFWWTTGAKYDLK
jgi:hypothetical protein